MIGNILGLALSLIPQESALLYRWQTRSENAVGFDVDGFGPPEPLAGRIQPVDRARYGYLGLDASKSYITIYSPTLMQDLTRDSNPDQIEYKGRRYRVMNRSDWTAYADFVGVMAVDIGPASGGLTP